MTATSSAGSIPGSFRQLASSAERTSEQPRLHQRADEIYSYGTVGDLSPLHFEEPVRRPKSFVRVAEEHIANRSGEPPMQW